jgi:hypothetical protein
MTVTSCIEGSHGVGCNGEARRSGQEGRAVWEKKKRRPRQSPPRDMQRTQALLRLNRNFQEDNNFKQME